jgi:hypothetical protein
MILLGNITSKEEAPKCRYGHYNWWGNALASVLRKTKMVDTGDFVDVDRQPACLLLDSTPISMLPQICSTTYSPHLGS